MFLTQPIILNITGIDISTFSDVGMLLIAGISAFYAYRAYNHQKERSRKEAACKLAKYYAEVICHSYTHVSSIFRITKTEEYIREIIDINKICDFDSEELDEILRSKNVSRKEFMERVEKVDPIVLLGYKVAFITSSHERDSILSDFIQTDNETGKQKIKNTAFLLNDFFGKITSLMNQLEWFAMNCQYGIADEELLYQSLHQTYLPMVLMLYPKISNKNTSNEDKEYTNVIWLFNKWRDRLLDIQTEAEKKKQIYQRKADQVRAKVYTGRKLK